MIIKIYTSWNIRTAAERNRDIEFTQWGETARCGIDLAREIIARFFFSRGGVLAPDGQCRTIQFLRD